MGLFGNPFEKKECSACGGRIGHLRENLPMIWGKFWATFAVVAVLPNVIGAVVVLP